MEVWKFFKKFLNLECQVPIEIQIIDDKWKLRVSCKQSLIWHRTNPLPFF